MDLKTLEYLEQRAKKGRAVVSRINELLIMKKRIEKGHKVVVHAGDYRVNDYANYQLAENVGVQPPDSFRERAQARMIAILLEEIDAEIARLEQELAEL